MCVCVCLPVYEGGGAGVKNVRKTYEEGGTLLKTYESVQGAGEGGSKIGKFKRTHFLNDLLNILGSVNHATQ